MIDTSGWYHAYVYSVDTTESADEDNNVKIYVNGRRITKLGNRALLDTATNGNTKWNSTETHRIGRRE